MWKTFVTGTVENCVFLQFPIYVIMKKISLLAIMLFLISGCFAQYRISGNVTYKNTNAVTLDSTTVYLSQNNTVLAQTNTNVYGSFHFDSISNGTYTLTATSLKKWGGVNSTDSYLILSYFLNITSLSDENALAANVDGSGYVNTVDALMAAKRFIQAINSFPGGDWAFGSKTVSVNNANVVANIKGLCRGDVDASYNPPTSFTCGGNLVDTRDGQAYPTVQLGNKCWMAKNLNVGTFIYGVGNQENNYIIEKYCYSNITSNCTQFGGMYQWREMMNYDTIEGSQGICPEGWHLPTDGDWDTIIALYPGTAGTALQAGGASGFNALLGGWVYNCSKFRQMNYQGYYWSSGSYWGLYGWARMFTLFTNSISHLYKSKDDGMYVRCIKD